MAGLALPVLAGAWFAGSGYVEFNDRLAALERFQAETTQSLADGRQRAQEFARQYEREQAEDRLVNQQVQELAKEVGWLSFHHHDEIGGRGHVD